MRAALDPNGADAYWAGRFGLIPLKLEPLDLGFLVLLIFSSSDLLLPCVDVTDRPGYDRIFPSPPFGPRHLPVHCRLVSCTCTLLVIYTDPAAPFSHISQSSLEASTICLP